MSKAESKYFNTALKMDEAFLELLSKKDLAYITVKEICEKAGVNRSTFYLHYETLGDLLSESVEYMNGKFLSYMKPEFQELLSRLYECSLDELYLITPEYLTPYLNYIKENKWLFRTAKEKPEVLGQQEAYEDLLTNVFLPILERFQVPEENRRYLMAFYIHGMIAVIMEWLDHDCFDPIEKIVLIIKQCVMGHEEYAR